MLTRIDGLQIAAADAEKAGRPWRELLGAEPERSDQIDGLAARRQVLRIGTGRIEILEPLGPGPVQDAVDERAGQLFGVVVAVRSLASTRSGLDEIGAAYAEQHGQLFLSAETLGGQGLRMALIEETQRNPVGLISRFYEVTNLVTDFSLATARYAKVLGLDTDIFQRIHDPVYGYDGVLTLFGRDRLDRFEVITPHDETKAMGRFMRRYGPSLYMAFAECQDIEGIEERAGRLGLPFSRDVGFRGRHVGFIHPAALGGVMLGISRLEFAWDWSGDLSRVPAALRAGTD